MLKGSSYDVNRDYPNKIVYARESLLDKMKQLRESCPSANLAHRYPAKLMLMGNFIETISQNGMTLCVKVASKRVKQKQTAQIIRILVQQASLRHYLILSLYISTTHLMGLQLTMNRITTDEKFIHQRSRVPQEVMSVGHTSAPPSGTKPLVFTSSASMQIHRPRVFRW